MKRLINLVLFVLVLGLFAPITGLAAEGFKDVSTNYTFYDEVLYLSSEKVILGFSDGTFKPNNPVTRAQAAIMLGRALDLNGEPRNTKFTDVSSRVTGSGYIASAVEQGIISGFTDGSYRPYAPITRAQMAIFLNRAYTLATGKENEFSDVSSNMAAYQSILNVSASGIASGYSDGTYRPDLQVTRGQFSAFMARTLEPPYRAVNFSDENLEKALRERLRKPNESITFADMGSFVTMEAYGYSIKNLSGIEFAQNLVMLDLGGNEIKDIGPISGLAKLEVLNLYNNQISDISILSGLTKLNVLVLSTNLISDISPLSQLNNLQTLSLPDNKISDISALSGLTNLIALNLSTNEINDISALSGSTKLISLQLGFNPLSDFSALSGLSNLKNLNLSSTQFSNFSVLNSLTNLSELDVSFTGISDISGLSELTNLRVLNLSSNYISDITSLSRLENLEYLNLSHNRISDISALSELTKLQYLTLTDNQLNSESLKIIEDLKANNVTVDY